MLHFARRFTRIQVVTVSCSIRLLALALVLALPASRLSFASFLSVVLLFSYFGVVADVYWQPLLREITTTDDRGSFFARMRFWFHTVGWAVLGLLTLVVGKQVTEGQYKFGIVLAILGTANYLFWSFRLPNLDQSGSGDYSWRHLYRVAFTSPLLRRPLLINLLINFAGVPLIVVYQHDVLKIPDNVNTAFFFVFNISSAFSLMFWGRIADRIGYRPVINGILLLMILITPLFLLAVPLPTSQFAWTSLSFQAGLTLAALFLFNFFDGILQSGLGIGTTTLQHFHVRHHETVEAMNLLAMISGLSGSLASIWSGYLLKYIVPRVGDITFLHDVLHLDAVKIYLLVGLVPFRILTIALCAQLPNSRPNQPLRSFFHELVAVAASPFRRRS